jgi:hypothetical protein
MDWMTSLSQISLAVTTMARVGGGILPCYLILFDLL